MFLQCSHGLQKFRRPQNFNTHVFYTSLLKFIVINVLRILQMTQLLVCDWLLETRTSLWQDSLDSDNVNAPVSNTILLAFQKNLTSLRHLTQHVPVRN